ncbi:MAG TPA: recombinase family protein [Bryobacteraceae bacterium]
MERSSAALRRCAVYTRKSSEEGLEQNFNSLHAQRDACESFIKSQAGEGWRLVKTAYDDGGLSGGTMERPALLRLLADIRDQLIDVVVVYKVDRLTRSLADFAKMVEIFDSNGVSFVAVTQQFNTTTSMGRLTLNVLLSFAQFEREVTGERIRDKIAASKKKGIWMGGTVPLGYDWSDRRLVVNPAEAATVRLIFERYLKLRSVRLLKEELTRDGVVSKIRVSKRGDRSGGQAFGRGALYELLANPIYLGEIRHRKVRHPGQHQAVVDRSVWDKAQQLLRTQAAHHRTIDRGAVSSPLAGKLFDEKGQPLYACGASKRTRRYRYYVSRKVIQGSSEKTKTGWRLPALEIERAVARAGRQMLGDRPAIATVLQEAGVPIGELEPALKTAERESKQLARDAEVADHLRNLIDRVQLQRGGFRVSLNLRRLIAEPIDTRDPASFTITRFIPLELKRRGVELRLVIESDNSPTSRPDPSLLKVIARGRRWFNELASGRAASIREIAKREGLYDSYVKRLIPLAFLAPEIVRSIGEGSQPATLTAEALKRTAQLPLEWSKQRQILACR